MSPLGPREMAEVLTVQAGEMLRIWRLARYTVHPQLLPGLSDGALESFFAALGPLLAAGARPSDVGARLSGVLRVPPQGGEEQVADEWKVVQEVLHTACESLGAREVVEDWLRSAAEAGMEAVLCAARGEAGAPPGIVRVRVYSGLALRPQAV
jgi:hypothetical protein